MRIAVIDRTLPRKPAQVKLPLPNGTVSSAFFCLALFIEVFIGLGVSRADPVAKWDYSQDHDYQTVDISALGPLELTYVPEKRKEPLLRALLSGADWSLQDDRSQEKFCPTLLRQLKEWRDVSVHEPEIRANQYNLEPFARWRKQCPKLIPHRFGPIEQGQTARFYYGDRGFRAFGGVVRSMDHSKWLLYFEGARMRNMSPEGNLPGPQSQESYAGVPKSGEYRIIDLARCEITAELYRAWALNFDYFDRARRQRGAAFLESAVLSVGQRNVVVSVFVEHTIKRHSILHIHDLEYATGTTYPVCRFAANVPPNLFLRIPGTPN